MEVRLVSMHTLMALVTVSSFIGGIAAQAPPRPPLNIIVIHGDVLCKNCTGTGPAEGSTVELRCNNTSGTPVITQNATVTSQGYFVIQMERFDNVFQAGFCRVFPLRPPPNKTCTKFADRKIAAYGAPLTFEITGPTFFTQYNVTTFVWKKPKYT